MHFIIHLGTFNVQNLTITSPSNGEVCFECIYISGINDVPGCYINLTSSQSGSNISLTINNEDMKCESISDTNLYHILVYDIESNGTTYTQQPAYETSTMITVTSTMITVTSTVISTNIIGTSTMTTVMSSKITNVVTPSSTTTLDIIPSSTNVEASQTTSPTVNKKSKNA